MKLVWISISVFLFLFLAYVESEKNDFPLTSLLDFSSEKYRQKRSDSASDEGTEEEDEEQERNNPYKVKIVYKGQLYSLNCLPFCAMSGYQQYVFTFNCTDPLNIVDQLCMFCRNVARCNASPIRYF